MKPLTTTGFALLAQIALKPASAYELTRVMRKNLHYLWPRAESRMYSEVVRLESAGLIAGRDERVGRRERRIMSVTASGREALRTWMSRGVDPGIPLGSEALLRMFFASWGSVSDLRRAVTQIHDDAQELLSVAAAIGADYLDNKGTVQEQAHTRAMIHELLSRYGLLLSDWSATQLTEISTWKDLSPKGKQRNAHSTFEATMELLAKKRLPSKGATRGR